MGFLAGEATQGELQGELLTTGVGVAGGCVFMRKLRAREFWEVESYELI